MVVFPGYHPGDFGDDLQPEWPCDSWSDGGVPASSSRIDEADSWAVWLTVPTIEDLWLPLRRGPQVRPVPSRLESLARLCSTTEGGHYWSRRLRRLTPSSQHAAGEGTRTTAGFRYQNLDLGRFVPTRPVWSQGVRLRGVFRGFLGGARPSKSVIAGGLQQGCQEWFVETLTLRCMQCRLVPIRAVLRAARIGLCF